MKTTHPFPHFRLAFLSLLFSGASIATDLAIDNASFENPTVAQEVYTVSPSNWTSYNGAVMGSEVYVYNPFIGETEFDDFTNPPPDGSQVLGIVGAAEGVGVVQQVAATFQAASQYMLSVKVGSSAYVNELYGFPGYQIQLVAGDTVIKTASGDGNSVGFGEFITVNVTYDFDLAHAPLDGEPLKIRLLSGGGDLGEVAFDDAELTALLANPVADAGGPYYLPNPTVSLSLDASASFPSGMASIAAYEWDLDNDGAFDDATGVTPAAISFSDLREVYGMADGSNPVFVRVTDSDNKTAIAEATVELVTSTKYIGGNASKNDTWNSMANWDNGVPEGELDVVILSGKTAMAWSDATPYYTGNLTLQNNSQLIIGWTSPLLGSYNALGTPGFSKIIMNPGSSILTRMGGAPIIPEIQLLADALINLGTSTQGGAQAQFNYPVTGPYRLQLQGNNQGSCIANLNTANGFSELLASGTEGGLTVRANTAGSLGTGDVNVAQRTGNTTNYAILEINAANAMADTGTLSLSGTSPTRLRMNANDTIARFIVNGAEQPLGTYGSTSSSAAYKVSWITGTGILTVATPAVGYWDLNGVTAGAGSPAPGGTWNAGNTYWNDNAAGTGSVAAWTPGDTAIFSAGSDATGEYDIEVVGSQDIGGLLFQSGSVNLNQGSGAALRLTSNSNLNVISGSTTIATPINESSSRVLSKSGVGSLTLSGSLSHTGGTSLLSGNLTLSGNNASATGATTVTSGVLRVDAPNSIPGTTRNATIDASGTMVFGPSFGSSNIQTALNNRIVTSSAGSIAADNNPTADFNFSTAGLTSAYFGSLSDVNYSGTLTPQGGTYRLSGQGGTLTMANTNALTSAAALLSRGNVVLAANNNYSGTTTVSASSSLALLGSTGTSGITLNSGSILTIGNNGSLGSGTLTLAGISKIIAVGTVVTSNAVAANADFIIGGAGALTLGTTTINNNRVITNASSGTTTFGSITRDGANNRTLTINGGGNTTVAGSLVLGTGTLTKNDSSTLTLQGSNTYGATTVNSGILRLDGSLSGAATTTLNAGRLQFGSDFNGGLASGEIIINNASAVIEAMNADRSILNNINMSNNGTFTGSHSLTVNGTLTNNNGNRILTNNIASTKALTLGNVALSQNTSNRTLTLTGSGNTVVNGVIENGGGSTAGNLIKSGSGTLILNGANTYAGTTTVSANGGKLFVNGSTGTGNLVMNSGTTLAGTGIIGGNTTIAAGGLLEFEINPDHTAHDKLELASGRSLTFSGASVLTITGTPTEDVYYTLLTAPGGIIGALPTLNVPDGWVAALSKDGNDLRLMVTYTENLPNPPTLVSIEDDQGGGPVLIYTPVTYTVTFDQDMNVTTFSTADFDNAGTAAITFGAIAEPSPGVFTIQVTPTTAGTLRFRINQGASLRSTTGLNLNTSSALLDDDTLEVEQPAGGVLAVSLADFISSGGTGGPFSPPSKQYTLTNYGGASLDWTVGKSAAWLSLSSSNGTLAPGANTTVTVSSNGSANSLAVGTYYDSITFTNTTTGDGNTTRAASLTVNGLPAVVTLGNLGQTYDGSPKSVSVTTNPTPLAYSITYNGLAEVPTDAGTYDVVATVTDPDYTASASATLVINKATQTINFAALDPVDDDQPSLMLTATASSGLPVSFSSSNSEVATVSEGTATIIAVGTTTITASQAGNENYESATNVPQELNVVRSNPLAVPGGPYTASNTMDLVLDGSASLPSYLETIETYEWDLNVNDNGGAFNANVTGATSAAISVAVLQGTYAMTGGSNTIKLRVTDSAAKTSIVTTTVNIVTPLLWDANNTGGGQTDGGGGWLGTNQWWTGSINTNWVAGRDARFGNGGAGGGVTLPTSTSVGSITFNTFTGTYTLGTASQMLTINGGLTKSAGSSVVTVISPVNLGADQTWTNPASTLTVSSSLDLSDKILTVDNVGAVSLSGVISGSGGIIKNGTGRLTYHTGNANTFTGPTIINGGVLMYGTSATSLGTGNITLNGGVIEAYWSTNMTRSLGAASGQIQIIGGSSGFSLNGSTGASVIINNSANYEVVWGSEYFSPDVLILQTPTAQNNSSLSFQNKIDLNGATRTVQTAMTSGTGAGSATISGIIRNSSITPAGLIKTGTGRLNLNAANTYNGGTTLQEGTLQLGNLNGLGSSIGSLTVNGGLLNLNNIEAVTVGNLTGTGGTIANNGTNARTFHIGNGGGTGGNFQGVIANNTNSGAGTLSLTKTGTGAITLSGANSYTGITNINQGKLFINGSTAGGNVAVASGATLGGTGTLGGNTTIAAGGKLEFNLSTPALSHDPLNIVGGKALAFSGASELTINVSLGAETGTYVLVTGGNNITGSAPATLNLPPGFAATVSIVGNELRLLVTDVGDLVPPTLVGIADNQAGGPILINTLVTYTVTFSEDMDAATVSAADFANAGTSAITIGTITETSPGVFTVQVTPITAGTLQLSIPTIAAIQDTAGNALVSNPPLDDNTIITVIDDPYVAWSNGAGFLTDTNNDGIDNGLAWLLGAADPADNVRDLLPVADENAGNLTISFHTLRPADRGEASIKVQYSKDMGVTDPWATNEAEVPGVSGEDAESGIVFVIGDAGDFISVQATIPAAAALPGKKLFTRLSATMP